MTSSAWVTLAVVWTVVGTFACGFFMRVLKNDERGPVAPPVDPRDRISPLDLD
jgi:hypothetical protein